MKKIFFLLSCCSFLAIQDIQGSNNPIVAAIDFFTDMKDLVLTHAVGPVALAPQLNAFLKGGVYSFICFQAKDQAWKKKINVIPCINTTNRTLNYASIASDVYNKKACLLARCIGFLVVKKWIFGTLDCAD